MKAKTDGNISFWHADNGGVPAHRDGLPGDRDADVCIVGAGYTGLWTAYYLKKADPSLRIIILDKEIAGFGAAGRNGGALTGGFGWSREEYLKTSSRSAVIDMSKAMVGAVAEVIAVCEAEGIDADVRPNDWMKVATTPAQWQRAQQNHEYNLSWGVSKERISLIGRKDSMKRIRMKDTLGAAVTHGTASVQPAKLVRGLAAAVEKLGVKIFEQTEVTRVEKGLVTTTRGSIRASFTVLAVEGFTSTMSGYHRSYVPIRSAMVVTEPLSKEMWDEIGWSGNEFLSNHSHLYFYAQRTREDRIAIGGGGNIRYFFGSKIDDYGRTVKDDVRANYNALTHFLPQTKGVGIDHSWCGVFGMPRDLCASVGLDRGSGMAWAGGYAGLGISTSNIAGQTLSDLILDRDTNLVRLPWVNHRIRKWESEPLRWLGIKGSQSLYALADRLEADGRSKTSYPARLAGYVSGMSSGE